MSRPRNTEWTGRFGALEAKLIYDLGRERNVGRSQWPQWDEIQIARWKTVGKEIGDKCWELIMFQEPQAYFVSQLVRSLEWLGSLVTLRAEWMWGAEQKSQMPEGTTCHQYTSCSFIFAKSEREWKDSIQKHSERSQQEYPFSCFDDTVFAPPQRYLHQGSLCESQWQS